MKRISAIKVATMKITNDFCYERKPSHATTKSTLFAVSKDEGGHWQIHKECIISTAVSKKAPLGLK